MLTHNYRRRQLSALGAVGSIIDGYGSGDDGATTAAVGVLGSGRRRRHRGGGVVGQAAGPAGVPCPAAGGPSDLGRREADEAGAAGVGQGRRVHGGQQQHLLLLSAVVVVVHETQGIASIRTSGWVNFSMVQLVCFWWLALSIDGSVT